MAAKKKCLYCGFRAYEMIKVNVGSFCNAGHAIKWARKKADKDKLKAAKLESLKVKKAYAKKVRTFYDNDKPLRVREAQKAFNAFIRYRDRLLPCVSCGIFTDDKDLVRGSRWDCGHFKSRGAHPELRFEELNCAKQCVKCNRDGSGNIANYRVELIKRIGIEKLDWLEGPHEAKKYTCADLKVIELHYKAKLKQLTPAP
jgi:hypothetical protein